MSHIIATFAPHKQKYNTKCPNSNISERKRSLRHTLFTTQWEQSAILLAKTVEQLPIDGLCEDFSDTPHYTLVSEFTYEYDEYGNWILQYMCAKDKMGPDELFIREIEYQTE